MISKNPTQGKQLGGPLKGLFSWRIRDYRILYEIKKKEVHIYILRIDHRKKAYK